jgi:hypothetical protein
LTKKKERLAALGTIREDRFNELLRQVKALSHAVTRLEPFEEEVNSLRDEKKRLTCTCREQDQCTTEILAGTPTLTEERNTACEQHEHVTAELVQGGRNLHAKAPPLENLVKQEDRRIEEMHRNADESKLRLELATNESEKAEKIRKKPEEVNSYRMELERITFLSLQKDAKLLKDLNKEKVKTIEVLENNLRTQTEERKTSSGTVSACPEETLETS